MSNFVIHKDPLDIVFPDRCAICGKPNPQTKIHLFNEHTFFLADRIQYFLRIFRIGEKIRLPAHRSCKIKYFLQFYIFFSIAILLVVGIKSLDTPEFILFPFLFFFLLIVLLFLMPFLDTKLSVIEIDYDGEKSEITIRDEKYRDDFVILNGLEDQIEYSANSGWFQQLKENPLIFLLLLAAASFLAISSYQEFEKRKAQKASLEKIEKIIAGEREMRKD